MQVSTGRIKALDGLRAFAIIFVFFRHAFNSFGEQVPENFTIYNYNLLTPFMNGWIGVDLFFILSGFLITLTFMKHIREKGSLKTYALKRVLRVVPAYYAALLVLSVIALLSGKMAAGELGVSFLYHILFLQDYLPANINVVFWSLGVEEKFYIIAVIFLPFTFFVRNKYKIKGLVALISSIILIGMLLRYLSYIMAGMPSEYDSFFFTTRAPFHCCFDPLLIGVLIALIFNSKTASHVILDIKNAKRVFVCSFMALILLMCSHVFLNNIGTYDALFQPLLIALIMGGMVFGAVFGGGFKWLESKVLSYIAVLSYSLYLVHLPLLPVCYSIAISLTLNFDSTLIFMIIFLAFYVLLSWLCAVILHSIVEKPFLKIKDRL